MNSTAKKVLIVANNNSFTTWIAKQQWIAAFFSPIIELQFSDVKNTSFTNIPLVKTTIDASLPQNEPESAPCIAYVIDPVWYKNYILPLANGYDAVIFVVNSTDVDPATGLIPAGVNTGSYEGTAEITLFLQPESENWEASQSGVIYPSAIAFIAAHEISHWLYDLFAAPADNTHEYFYSPDPAGVLAEIKTAMENQNTKPVPTSPTSKFNPTVIKWAQAMQAQESSKPPLATDRNIVNHNPGNIKATAYGLSLGETTGVDVNGITTGKGFCIYKDYQTGFDALCELLTDAASDELIAFHSSMSILQFVAVYAVPPNDNYALAVAAALEVPVSTPIGVLIA